MSSMSGSGPGSGSYSSGGVKSACTPSCPPAASTWLTTSSNNEMACPLLTSYWLISRTASRNDSTWSATCCASSSVSGSIPAGLPAGVPVRVSSLMHCPPSLERSTEGDLVGVLKVPTHGQSTREPGHPDSQVGQEPGQVRRGRLALEVRIGGEDDLGDGSVGQPGHELLDPELIRADALDRGDRSAEDVVATAELAGALDRDHVLGLLHHADDRRVSPRVTADPAGLLLGDPAAHGAEPDLVLDLDEDLCEPADVDRVGLEQVERDPLRALRAHPGEPTELVDEVLEETLVHQNPTGGLPCPEPSPVGSAPGPSWPRLPRSSPPATGSRAWAASASARARASR